MPRKSKKDSGSLCNRMKPENKIEENKEERLGFFTTLTLPIRILYGDWYLEMGIINEIRKQKQKVSFNDSNSYDFDDNFIVF